MNLNGATIMILGGSGLVGHAVARRLLGSRPARIVLVALHRDETEETATRLAPHAGDTVIATESGNVYAPITVEDVYGDLTEGVIQRSTLVRLLEQYRPDAVVDCINTATAFAYQDVYRSSRELLALARDGTVDAAAVERHVLTLPIPLLTRHVQILREGLRRAGTRSYVKIGTSGTGGMGLNIPYTHSEERPSRTLLTKSAVAGAHTLLLYLLGRTPDAPATIEIKPTAAIGWREISFGPVRRAGKPIELVDCPKPAGIGDAFGGPDVWRALGRPLESVYINMGENGLFAREEFATITALGQMEFITPEEIAEYVALEIEGHPSGRDVIAALDASTAGPTYRAGMLREAAMDRLDALETRHRSASVAFEMLGPPRLTKLLFEAYLLSQLYNTVHDLAAANPGTVSADAERLIASDPATRSAIISVGIPILSADGASVYRGPHVVVPPAAGDPLAAVPRGWVDLRPANAELWVQRARHMMEQADRRRTGPQGSGSDEHWYAIEPNSAIAPWRMATWIFANEDQGERIKR